MLELKIMGKYTSRRFLNVLGSGTDLNASVKRFQLFNAPACKAAPASGSPVFKRCLGVDLLSPGRLK